MPKPLSEDKFRLSTALALSALIGGLVFLLAAPASILKPTNIAWLHAGDFSANYLGWLSYRNAPPTVPPGDNPSYGLELSSSIFYADALPIIALPVKWLSPLLPEPFQYFGLWVLACFILQAYFSFRLTERLGLPPVACIGFATLACLFPPFLLRLTQHLALSGHWLILAGFAEYFRAGEDGSWRWPALCAIASMVHPYLLIMVLALWLATRIRSTVAGQFGIAQWLVETTTVLAAVALGLWLGGFFSVRSGYSAFGYGYYQLNLLALMDPDRFSVFLPDLPGLRDDYEGYAYPGLGGVLVLAAGAGAGLSRRGLRGYRQHWPLALVVGVMLAYAVSNIVTLADYRFELFRLPEFLIPITSSLRGSSRFSWPALYLALLAGYVLMWRHRHIGIRTGSALVGLVVALQGIDITPVLKLTRWTYSASGALWDIPLKSPFWGQVAAEDLAVRRIPVENMPVQWDVFSYYALNNGLRTDSVYLARIDEHALAASRRRTEIAVTSGRFSAGAIYIVDMRTARSVRARYLDGFELLTVDGFPVVAPSDLVGSIRSERPKSLSGDELFQQIDPGDHLQVAEASEGAELLGLGWRSFGQQGMSAQGGVSELVFRLRPPENVLQFRLDGRCLGRPSKGVTVTVNGHTAALTSGSLSADSLTFEVPRTQIKAPPAANVIQLQWGSPVERPWSRTSVGVCQVPMLQEVSLQTYPVRSAK